MFQNILETERKVTFSEIIQQITEWRHKVFREMLQSWRRLLNLFNPECIFNQIDICIRHGIIKNTMKIIMNFCFNLNA